MKTILSAFVLMLLLTSCRKEIENVYAIDPVYVSQSGQKNNLKSDLQFVSIAYSDLFGQQISTTELNAMLAGYNSVGDKALVIDLIIRNLLVKPGIIKSSQLEMQNDPDAFIDETFERFFVREANEMEKWYFGNSINSNSQLLPEDIYYALMSAEEYRHY